ncbi:hypothetical protein [Streptomyces sp. NPDC086777]|uniref:hypothetical protein n=1 Tax=Streptomyces sp. NPDC086777 TaxID=3154866 RepID=UPI00344D8B7B
MTYLARERAVTLDAVARNGWHLVVVERADELSPGEVLSTAERRLRPWLAERGEWAREG